MDDDSLSVAAEADVLRLLTHVDELGLQPRSGARGWTHMGAVICDAGLQAGIKYSTVVLPKLRRLVQMWPDATTTSAFVARLSTDELGAVLGWHGPKKLTVIDALAKTLLAAGIDTVTDLADAYASEEARATLATRLRKVKGVGPKTVDYLAILVGSDQHVAIDNHLRSFARDAGARNLTYDGLRELYVVAARRRGWAPGDLDRAVWHFQTGTKDH